MGTKRNNGELRTVVCRRALLPVVCLVCFISKAAAADINGAWATSVDACTKVFVKKGSQTYLSNDADIHGSGFVIDGAVLRGKIATCKLTSRKDDGTTVHLQAACATDIMVSSNQVDLKMIDQDQLMRIVPGIPEMDTPYYRCPQQ